MTARQPVAVYNTAQEISVCRRLALTLLFFCCLLTSVAEDSVEIFRVSTIIGMREKLECAPEINPGFMLHK
jgi:hypothetical protein